MSRNSYEWKLEDWAIRAAQYANMFPETLPKLHHDDREQAAQERIVFEAVTGDEEPAGSGVFTTELAAEFRSTNREVSETDDMFAALMAAFASPGAIAYATELFPGGLWFDQDASENSRNDGRDSKTRSRTFSFSVAHVSA